MILRTKLIASAAMALMLIAAGSNFASDNKKDGKQDNDTDMKFDTKKPNVLVIKGKVIGDDGKPQAESEIRVRRLDQKRPETSVITDSRGKYIVLNLVVGNYSVTAYDPNGFARSRAIIKVDRKGWAKVDFDLGLDKTMGDNAAGRVDGHEHFTQPNSHGGVISAVQ
jgi:hypothetical protein